MSLTNLASVGAIRCEYLGTTMQGCPHAVITFGRVVTDGVVGYALLCSDHRDVVVGNPKRRLVAEFRLVGPKRGR
jgi:hypothetical protein